MILSMVDTTRIELLIEQATTASTEAIRLRKLYRRRTKSGSETRQQNLAAAVDDIEAVMKDIRSEMGRLSYLHLPPKLEDSFRESSRQAQLERHKLLKMLGLRARA